MNQNSKVKMQNYNPKFKSDLRQRCFQLSLDVMKMTDTLPNKRSAWIITDQLIRSTTSIGANLVEARASSSRLEFKKFYEISLKSANETLYWLEPLRDSGLMGEDQVMSLHNEVDEIARMVASGVLRLKDKKF